jgi:hypothetical protein
MGNCSQNIIKVVNLMRTLWVEQVVRMDRGISKKTWKKKSLGNLDALRWAHNSEVYPEDTEEKSLG